MGEKIKLPKRPPTLQAGWSTRMPNCFMCHKCRRHQLHTSKTPRTLVFCFPSPLCLHTKQMGLIRAAAELLLCGWVCGRFRDTKTLEVFSWQSKKIMLRRFSIRTVQTYFPLSTASGRHPRSSILSLPTGGWQVLAPTSSWMFCWAKSNTHIVGQSHIRMICAFKMPGSCHDVLCDQHVYQ